MTRPFMLETFVDFPDDSTMTPLTITPTHVDALMATLVSHGIGRVLWGYYGDGHGGWFVPAGIDRQIEKGLLPDADYWGANLRSREALGHNPLRVAVEAAHRHGLELYGYFKPYETGASMVFPEGSPEAMEWGRLEQIGGYNAWLDPFVLNNPHLRLKRRTDDLWPGHENAVIHTIKLTKKDDAPTKLRKEHLRIWTSPLNYNYKPKAVDFEFTDTIETCKREVRDTFGNIVTRAGDRVRVLTLKGINLADKYIAISADMGDEVADFENTWDRMLTAYDERGREIPGVCSAGGAIWFPHMERFPQTGLVFDTGWGTELVTLETPKRGDGYAEASSHISHSVPGQKNVRGVVAFARGRNPYASGALCETEPRVQEFWLSCIGEMLDAGVDGVEFRVENHSCHSVTPEDYGFNPAVMAKVSVDSGGVIADVTRVRSEAYTEFVRRAKKFVASRGKKLRINLNVDWFRPASERPGWRRIAYPANIEFNWEQWVDERLLDEAVLRIFAMPFDGIFKTDAVAQNMIGRCNRANIPLSVNRYVWENHGVLKEFEQVRSDGRFAGFVFYQTWAFMKVNGKDWDFSSAGRDGDEKGPDWKTRLEMSRLVRDACASVTDKDAGGR